MKFIVVLLTLGLSIQANAEQTIIYGEDNRVDVDQMDQPQIKHISKSIAGRVLNFKIEDVDAHKVSFGEPALLSDPWRGNVCADERFASQPTVTDCTGFLVGEDLLVTAGHCLTPGGTKVENATTRACDSYSWVFDYKVDGNDEFDLNSVPKKNVYKCKEVIFAIHEREDDYAIIKLDRKVEGREPLKLSTKKPALESEIFVIGHPSGLPLKYADGAQVKIMHENFFAANLDTFGGNSGSPVFNKVTNEVEGILVRGDTDYVMSQFEGESCRRVNTCDNNLENCQEDAPDITGEHVSLIEKVKKYL